MVCAIVTCHANDVTQDVTEKYWMKNAHSFCLNSIVEQYNITAKLGTFFMSHVYFDTNTTDF